VVGQATPAHAGDGHVQVASAIVGGVPGSIASSEFV
jgi:hypothetical protein